MFTIYAKICLSQNRARSDARLPARRYTWLGLPVLIGRVCDAGPAARLRSWDVTGRVCVSGSLKSTVVCAKATASLGSLETALRFVFRGSAARGARHENIT